MHIHCEVGFLIYDKWTLWDVVYAVDFDLFFRNGSIVVSSELVFNMAVPSTSNVESALRSSTSLNILPDSISASKILDIIVNKLTK